MVFRETPTVFAISSTVQSPPSYICRATLTFWGVITGGRPPFLPLARAAASPALVRSRDQVPLELGQGAHDLEEQPAVGRRGVEGLLEASQAHLRARPGPRRGRSGAAGTCPSRSSRQTTTVSPGRSWSRSRSSWGRRSRAPEVLSVKVLMQPADGPARRVARRGPGRSSTPSRSPGDHPSGQCIKKGSCRSISTHSFCPGFVTRRSGRFGARAARGSQRVDSDRKACRLSGKIGTWTPNCQKRGDICLALHRSGWS